VVVLDVVPHGKRQEAAQLPVGHAHMLQKLVN
jgi:hypothetical protein